MSTAVRRRTQAERRAVTRRAMLDATLDVLAEVGYGGLIRPCATSPIG